MLIPNKHVLSIDLYRPGKPIQELRRETGLRRIIKMASNENPLGPSPLAVRAIRTALSRMQLYPEGSCHELRVTLSRRWDIHPDQLIFGNGSNELLVMIGQSYLQPGDETLFSDESFVVYSMVTHLQNARGRVAPAQGHAHDLAAMRRLLTKRTKVIFLCNPNNPTGTLIRSRGLRSFMKDIPSGCLVVFDEAYAEYVQDPDYAQGFPYVLQNRNAIVLRTFSKIYGLAGLRVGYGIAPRAIIRTIEHVRQPFNVNAAAQVGALAALDDRDYLRRVRRVNTMGGRFLFKQLLRMGLQPVSSHANFIYFSAPFPADEIHRSLMKQGVIIRPVGPQSLRVTIGTDAQNRRFISRLKGILDQFLK